jgi:hypothetical protein
VDVTHEPVRVSDQLEIWQVGDGAKTLCALTQLFQDKSFAVLFVLLLGVPALPLPTGGATHVFELIAVLLGAQLIAGRGEVWLPRRWRNLELGGERKVKFIRGLMQMIRWLERFSRPRGTFLFDHRLTRVAFGVLAVGGSIAAFVAPPFSGLDTLPALGVVLLSLAVLLEDVLVVVLGLAVLTCGVVLEVVVGRAALHGLSSLF